MSSVGEFLIESERCMREYDTSSFVYNSINSLSGNVTPILIDVRNDIYQRSIAGAIAQLEYVTVDGKDINECIKLLQMLQMTPRFDKKIIMESLRNYDIKIRPEFLRDYSKNLSISLQKVIDKLDKPDSIRTAIADYTKFASEEMNRVVQHQVVRTSVNLDEMIASIGANYQVVHPKITCSMEYISYNVIPFLLAFNEMRAKTIAEGRELIKVISDTMTYAQARNQTILKLCEEDPRIANEQVPKFQKSKRMMLNNANYLSNRALLENLNFITYAYMLKASALVKNIKNCQYLCAQLESLSKPMGKLVSEGVFADSILPDNTGDLADDLFNGRVDALSNLATDVLNFHKTVVHPNIPGMDDADGAFEQFAHSIPYPADPYNSILEITSIIMSSLDVLFSASDDYLLVFDELIEKAGLDNPINVRYKDTIALIGQTPEYDSATTIAVHGNGNLSVYGKILGEIADFPKNVQTIADHIKDVADRIKEINQRFENNINREYQNSNSIEELKVFMDAFEDQFEDVVSEIAGNLMLRLKRLAINAEKISVSFDTQPETPEFESVDDTDYEAEIENIMLEFERAYTDAIMETLYEAHQVKWVKQTRGKEVLMQEIGEPTISTTPKSDGTQPTVSQPATPTPTATDPNAGKNQAAAAEGNGAAKRTLTERLNTLKNNLQKRFQEMLNKFRTNMANKTIEESVLLEQVEEYMTEAALRYPDWLSKYKDSLLNRSYANVSLQILPYASKMPYSQIISEAERFKNTVTAIKPGDISNMKTPADIYNKLYAAQGVVSFGSGTAVDECKSKANEALTKYYKVGKAPLEMVTFANNNLKSAVQDMITFCESYFNGEQEHLLNILDGIRGSVDSMSPAFVKESVSYYGEMLDAIFEADGDSKPSTTPTVTTTPQPETPEGTPKQNSNAMNTTQMLETIQDGASLYCGAVLNAVRDRINDYFKALQTLRPKPNPGQTQA